MNCPTHGWQPLHLTTPRVREALLGGQPLPKSSVRKVICRAFAGTDEDTTEYFADVATLVRLGFDIRLQEITLIRRDKIAKQLNDRVKINSLMREMANMVWCPACLREAMNDASTSLSLQTK